MFAALKTVNQEPFGQLSPLEVETLPPTVRVIDVREPAEFNGELGHIPRAELVPLRTVARASATWHDDEDLVVVCRSGGRSSQAAALLSSLGFRRVRNLSGGMLAYTRLGLPVARTS